MKKTVRIRTILRKTFLSLRNRNFTLFFIGQIISNTGNWLTNVALTLLILKLTGSGVAVGAVAACQFGPIVFLSPWAGAIADRSDKRKMILLTQTLEMLQSIGLAALAFLPHPPLAGLYVLALIGGIVLAFDNPLRRSFVSEMVREDDLPNAVVLYSTIVNVARIFGPALAGLLVVTVGYGWCFTLDAATYLAVIFCIYIMRTGELHRHPPVAKTKGEVRAGLRYIQSVPVLWISFTMLAAIGTLAYNFNVTLPLFVTGPLRSSEVVFTLLYSLYSFGSVVCALLVAHRSLVTIQHIILGAVSLGITMLLLAIVPSVVTAVPVIFLLGMTSILYMNATTVIVQTETRRNMHGRLLAIQTVLVAGSSLIGGPISGWMADMWGARSPMIFGGIVCLISAVFGYSAMRGCKTYLLPAEKSSVR